MDLPNRPYAYSKLQYEDPDEIHHRKAQFLIYKALQKADHTRNRPRSWLRVKAFTLKIKIGKRLMKLKKRMSSTVVMAKADLHKQISCVLKSCKYLLHGKQGLITRTNPPVF